MIELTSKQDILNRFGGILQKRGRVLTYLASEWGIGIAVEGEKGYYPTGCGFDKNRTRHKEYREMIMQANEEATGLDRRSIIKIEMSTL